MRLDIGETDLDRGQLVAPDAATQNLVEPCRRLELPLAGLVHERNWEGPIVGADNQGLRAVSLAFDRMLRLKGLDEFSLILVSATGSPELTMALPPGPSTPTSALVSPAFAAATKASTAASGVLNRS